MADHLDCWHFASETLRDGTPLPKAGETLTLPEGMTPALCVCGYHGSVRALDALCCAPAAKVARVRLTGTILESYDKACATSRTNLTDYHDATVILHEFACDVAELALQKELDAGREPDPRPVRAIETKRAWLRGQATDKQLAAARAAAERATRAAARDAARAAAWAAAWAAARAAAWAAAWDAQNAMLEQRLYALLGAANEEAERGGHPTAGIKVMEEDEFNGMR